MKWRDFDQLKLQVFISKLLPRPPILKSLWRCLWAILQLTTKKRWRCDLSYWTINVVREQSVSLSFSLVTAVQRPDTHLSHIPLHHMPLFCSLYSALLLPYSSTSGCLFSLKSFILSVGLPPAFRSWCFKCNLLSCVASEPNHRSCGSSVNWSERSCLFSPRQGSDVDVILRAISDRTQCDFLTSVTVWMRLLFWWCNFASKSEDVSFFLSFFFVCDADCAVIKWCWWRLSHWFRGESRHRCDIYIYIPSSSQRTHCLKCLISKRKRTAAEAQCFCRQPCFRIYMSRSRMQTFVCRNNEFVLNQGWTTVVSGGQFILKWKPVTHTSEDQGLQLRVCFPANGSWIVSCSGSPEAFENI